MIHFGDLESKVKSLYAALANKDTQIYLDRIRKQQGSHSQRQLFSWTMKDLEIHAFADVTLHGTENCISLMKAFNNERYPS